MKKAFKFLLPAAAIALVLLLLLWQNGVFAPKGGEGMPAGTVRLAIRCDRALLCDGLKDETRAVLPENGVMGEGTVMIYTDDTVFTVLTRYCKEHKIALSGVGATRYGVYVEGIGGLYELDGGEASGWMFSVNGEFPGKSAGDVTVSDGDEILWVYTLDLGKDVGSDAP